MAAGSGPERLRLRVDERAWRISVEPGAGGLAYCGWEVASGVELDRLAGRLDALGIPLEEDAGLAKERGVNGLLLGPAGGRPTADLPGAGAGRRCVRRPVEPDHLHVERGNHHFYG